MRGLLPDARRQDPGHVSARRRPGDRRPDRPGVAELARAVSSRCESLRHCGDGGGWADVALVDAKKQALVARWGGVWNRSLLQLAGDQNRLYASSQGVSPGKLEALPIPIRLEEKPTPAVARLPELPLGGPFL